MPVVGAQRHIHNFLYQSGLHRLIRIHILNVNNLTMIKNRYTLEKSIFYSQSIFHLSATPSHGKNSSTK